MSSENFRTGGAESSVSAAGLSFGSKIHVKALNERTIRNTEVLVTGESQ